MTFHQAALLGAWEAAALGVLEQLGWPPAPIDSLHLALRLKLRISPVPTPAAMMSGTSVMLWPSFSARRLRWNAAHEIAHWALKQRGLADSEDAADRVAETLLMPWYAFDPEQHDWHVGKLQQQHQHCSLETIARRILSLRLSCISVWERGKLVRRRCSRGTSSKLDKITRFESRLASAACKLGGVVQAGERLIGFVDDERPGRVITLCAAQELALRAGLVV